MDMEMGFPAPYPHPLGENVTRGPARLCASRACWRAGGGFSRADLVCIGSDSASRVPQDELQASVHYRLDLSTPEDRDCLRRLAHAARTQPGENWVNEM